MSNITILSKSDLAADLKGYFFPFTNKCSYFKISVNVRILRLYKSLSLTFWKILIFQWGLIKSGWLESVTFRIYYFKPLLLHKFIDLEPVMIWRPRKTCSKAILHLHSQLLDIPCFKSFFDSNSFSMADKKINVLSTQKRYPKAHCSKCK